MRLSIPIRMQIGGGQPYEIGRVEGTNPTISQRRLGLMLIVAGVRLLWRSRPRWGRP